MKKRARRKREAPAAAAAPRVLQYKVVELSTVDEGALERTLNEWTAHGWNLDGVQFAMRDSSKRPAMAFVFFTREVEAAVDQRDDFDDEQARAHLRRLAAVPEVTTVDRQAAARARLAELAGIGDDEEPL
jgi:hypothetical protein